jgi:hypothetical protein
MSTRRARWTQAQIDASNAEALLRDYAEGVAAEAVRQIITGSFIADLEQHGHDPGLIAAGEQALMALGEDAWLEIGRNAGLI